MTDGDSSSLDAKHALVRLAVAAGDYEEGLWQLRDAERLHEGVSAHRLVSVAPDVLGHPAPGAGDGDGDGDDEDDFDDDDNEFSGAGTFTVISPYPSRAAAALARVAPRLMDVDEHGKELTWEERERQEGGEIPYTPNFVFDTQWCQYGAMVQLDTKGCMWAAMGRTMVGILVDALADEAVPAHVAGYFPALQTHWRVWEGPAG